MQKNPHTFPSEWAKGFGSPAERPTRSSTIKMLGRDREPPNSQPTGPETKLDNCVENDLPLLPNKNTLHSSPRLKAPAVKTLQPGRVLL